MPSPVAWIKSPFLELGFTKTEIFIIDFIYYNIVMNKDKLWEKDDRNLVDEYKFMSNEAIVAELDKKRLPLEIAIENLTHDFNIGTIVRNANAFNLNKVYILGKRRYNRRGAMVTDRYLHIEHFSEINDFVIAARKQGKRLVAIENNRPKAQPLQKVQAVPNAILILGSESDGISDELLSLVDDCYYIEQFGSTRSINVGCASAVALYEYVRRLGFLA